MSNRQLWGVVLAGGEGVRLRALSQRICGDQRPKQYVPILGASTLLRQTLDRVALGIAPARTVVVTLRSHAQYWVGSDGSHLLVQPSDRGTAAGILLPVHWIARWNPGATVAVFPSDHFVSEPAKLMAHITQIADWVDRHPERLVLLGARATVPEVEYGWIELGRVLDSASDGRIWTVRRFWEKPSEETARMCLDAGCLWNTFILVGKVATFLRAGREAVPEVDERLRRASVFLGTEDEAWALHQAYALMPRANFSRAILEPCPPFLAVAAMPGGAWSDLGTPRRVFEILDYLRSRPVWTLVSDFAAS
jgi:mannose-1-phosphate guanylyltransferase